MHIINFFINIYYPQYTVLHILSHCTSYTFYFIICSLFHSHLYLYIYSLVLCFIVLLLMLFLFFILLLLYYFFCTFHWADLSWLTFHYWLYPVWLCMWQIIKNLEPICSITGINVLVLRTGWPPLGAKQTEVGWVVGSVDVLTGRHTKLSGLTDVNREMTEPLIVLGCLLLSGSWSGPGPVWEHLGSERRVSHNTHTCADLTHTSCQSGAAGSLHAGLWRWKEVQFCSSWWKQHLKPTQCGLYMQSVSYRSLMRVHDVMKLL